MDQQLRCTQDGHENKLIDGICMAKSCHADQRILCMKCLKTNHAKCQNQFCDQNEFIQRLIQLKTQVKEPAEISQLRQLKQGINKTMKVQQFMNQILQQYKKNSNDIIDNILKNQQILSAKDWKIGYELLTAEPVAVHEETTQLIQQLNKLKESIDLITNSNIQQQDSSQIIQQPIVNAQWNKITVSNPVIINPKHKIMSIALSPDEQHIASAGCDGDFSICIWNLMTGQQVGNSLNGHTQQLKFVTCKTMSRAVLQPFEVYQKARVSFVQTVAELAKRPQNIEALQSAGVMSLLRPLLLDCVPSIQQSAALALGRLAKHSEDLAEAVVSNEILPQLVSSLGEQNRFYKKAAAFVLRCVAKHSPALAMAVVNSGALEALVQCLEEFDPSVKEAAASALRYIAKHTADLAQAVVDAGAVPLLVLCIQEPETTLKRVSAAALSEICKHSAELAQNVTDAGAAPFLSALIPHHDAELKRYVCLCLANIAKHTIDLAESVVEVELFPKILYRLKDTDPAVRKAAATCIREIARQSQELAKMICSAGAVVSIVDYINEAKGDARLPGIMTLGFIGAFDESLAMGVIAAKGIAPLKDALIKEPDHAVKSASAWALGMIGGHSADHAKAMAEADVPSHLLAVYKFQESSEDLKKKASQALKSILQMCTHLPALEPLISDAPPDILQYVLHQFQKTLPNDNAAKKQFVLSEGLKKIQEIKAQPGSKLRQYIDEINQYYPQEIIQYYSAGYEQQLLKKLDDYNAD